MSNSISTPLKTVGFLILMLIGLGLFNWGFNKIVLTFMSVTSIWSFLKAIFFAWSSLIFIIAFTISSYVIDFAFLLFETIGFAARVLLTLLVINFFAVIINIYHSHNTFSGWQIFNFISLVIALFSFSQALYQITIHTWVKKSVRF